ncbi:MAG: formate dehydrogenase accessory sulfurtransferase FdhD [Dehalococcoidia bacterium]|nr:formate dehydrogenase accessory sulfurtransferase FdhD [Dehalococcoidia bacterium]
MEKRSSEIEIFVVSRDGEEEKTDEIIREEEVVVTVDGEIHKFYCIPSDLEGMILGNLKSRGIDPSFSRIRKIADNEFNVDLWASEKIKSPQKCESNKELTGNEVFESVKALNRNSFLFQKTGCTHVIGICGDKEIFVEDTSRHCAIDKAIGLAIRDRTDLADTFLVTSCRQTASTIKKAIFCGIPIVISIAAPTDLAVREADEYRITLIGFANSKRFNVYSHEWRIKI